MRRLVAVGLPIAAAPHRQSAQDGGVKWRRAFGRQSVVPDRRKKAEWPACSLQSERRDHEGARLEAWSSLFPRDAHYA